MFDPEKYFEEKLELLRTSRKIQKRIILVILAVLLALSAKFAYELVPRHYNLSLTGGGLLSNRHHLAKILSDESAAKGVSLRVVPTNGSIEALDLVDVGKLDMALIQGGLDANYDNVTHVATISPELIHILVKPGIESIKDLRGKTINMGGLLGGTRLVAKQIFDLSGLKHGVDYIEKNYSDRDLIEMRAERLPDVIVLISYAPSDIVDVMVKKYGYDLLEIPFPPSLAIRLGWVADAKILGYMYSIIPAIPAKDIQVVGVNLHLVAHKNVDPKAVATVIETLYGPRVQNKFGQKISESDLLLPSGFPISAGTELFLSRKEPFISDALVDKIKALIGLLMTLGSTLLVIFKWLSMPGKEDEDKHESENDQGSGSKGKDKSSAPDILDKLEDVTDHLKNLSK